MAFSFGGGTTAPSSTGFSFGAATTQAAPPAFGAATGAAPAFGAATTTAPPAFGAATTGAPPAFGTGFGAATTSAAPAFGAATSTGFGFGSTGAAPGAATSSTGLSLNFGAPAATTSAAAPAFGGFGAATTSAAPAFGGFGAATATSTAAAPAFGGFGAAAATTSATPAFGGFGAAAPAVSSAAGGLGGSGTAATGLGGFTTAPAASIGLGGSTAAPSFGLGGQAQQSIQTSGETKKEASLNVKDAAVPAELGTTVEELKKYIKDERTVCSDISHVSDKQYRRIQEETDALSQLVTLLATGIHKNRLGLEKLKLASAQELLNVEIAQRTKETPASMQYENVAPMDYFVRLVSGFELDMADYRKQIDQTQQHLQIIGSSGSGVTSSDIVQSVQRLHAVFTELAAKYQAIHQELAKCKDQFVTVHRRIHGGADPSFGKQSGIVLRLEPALPKLSGPSPFSAPSDPLVQARASLPPSHPANQTQNAGLGPPTLGLNPAATPAGAFGSAAANQSFGASFGGGGGFGANTSGFGGNTSGFGAKPTGFGANTSAFGANTSGFGANTSAFGGNTSGIGGTSNLFGSPSFSSPFSSTQAFNTSSSFSSPGNGNKRNKI